MGITPRLIRSAAVQPAVAVEIRERRAGLCFALMTAQPVKGPRPSRSIAADK